MRVARVAASGLAAATMVLTAGSAASADGGQGAGAGSGTVQAQPNPARPGAIVTLFDGGLCGGANSATAVSRAFTGAVPLSQPANQQPGQLSGSATIANVPGGKYVINVNCAGGKSFTGFVNVTGSTPHGGAATGDGASQASVASPMTGGPMTGGAVLAAAGLGLGFVALRRRAAKKN